MPPNPAADGPNGLRAWNLASSLLALLAICLVPAVVGAALYLHHLRSTALRDAYGAADLVATGTSESLYWLLLDAETMLASVAARPHVRTLDPAACDPILAEFRTISPSFKTLALRLSDGRSLCSELQQPPSQESIASAPWFQAAIRRPGFTVSDGHPGTVNQPWAVRLTYPVADASGRPAALLITPVDLQQLQQRLFGHLRPDAVVAVVDSANRVVVRSTRQDERLGKPAAEGVARLIIELRQQARSDDSRTPASRQFAEVGIDGVRRLFVIRQVPKCEWVVVSGVSEDETLRGYFQARDRSLTVIAAVLILAGLAAWRVSRGIRQPVQALAAAARDLSRGDPTVRVAETGPAEVRVVAREFNNMVVVTARARALLLASEQRYRSLLQNLPVAVLSHASDGSVELFNELACALLRVTPAQLQGATLDAQIWHWVDAQGNRVPPQDHPAARVLRTGDMLPPTTLGVVAGGATAPHAWVMVTGYRQHAGDGGILCAVVAMVDISARHRAEQALAQSQARLAAVVEHALNAILLASDDGHYVDANPAASALTGYTRDELLAMHMSTLVVADSLDLDTAWSGFLQAGSSRGRIRLRRKDGTVIVATFNAKAQVLPGLNLSVLSDVTEEVLAQQRLESLAQTDSLTGISNRRHFLSLAADELARARRHGQPLALLMIDLDHFKEINDRHGHAAGDEVLRRFVQSVGSEIRQGECFARLGGDEFAVLLPQTGLEGAAAIARRLLVLVREHPAMLAGEPLHFTASFGVAALAAEAAATASIEELMRLADRALYRSKAGGRSRAEVSDDSN